MTQATPQARDIPTANCIPKCFDGRRVLGEGDSESYHEDQPPEAKNPSGQSAHHKPFHGLACTEKGRSRGHRRK